MNRKMDEFIKSIELLVSAAKRGPWEWVEMSGKLQLHGHIYAEEMNPILLTALGCGNDEVNKAGVKGCRPLIDDPLRCCPLHPSYEDREFIAQSRTIIPKLIELVLLQDRAITAYNDFYRFSDLSSKRASVEAMRKELFSMQESLGSSSSEETEKS